MSVTDNELTWRKVFAGPGIDVSGWSLDKRLRLPDWCFGNREVMSVSNTTTGVGNFSWKISGITLPTEICIWTLGILVRTNDSYISTVRIGFLDTLPTTIGEMDLAIPILPDFGSTTYTPPRIALADEGREVWQFNLRKGIDTGGLKMALELKCGGTEVALIVFLVYSELPTEIPAFLNPDIP